MGPGRVRRKHEFSRIADDLPVLAKTDRANDDRLIFMEKAANAQWKVNAILGAIGNNIIIRVLS